MPSPPDAATLTQIKMGSNSICYWMFIAAVEEYATGGEEDECNGLRRNRGTATLPYAKEAGLISLMLQTGSASIFSRAIGENKRPAPASDFKGGEYARAKQHAFLPKLGQGAN